MKTIKRVVAVGLLLTASFLSACSQVPPPPPETQAEPVTGQQLKSKPDEARSAMPDKAIGGYAEDNQLPVRFQKPSYLLKDQKALDAAAGKPEEKFIVQVGADVTSTAGPIPLKDILKRLAALKDMNVSWSSDVDQSVLVDVDIRAEDDFFQALDHLLRQQDYYHEVEGNTVVVKYKETRKFHIALPFMASTYNTGVGGDVLGASGAGGNVVGNLQLLSNDNKFDIWDNIRKNLNMVLDIWSEPTPTSAPAAAGAPSAYGSQAPAPAAATPQATAPPRPGKGYYTIDKPIGLITVTAPRPLLEKIASYLDNLKTELYRQVAIEAKIVEVTLDDSSKAGIDWNNLLNSQSFDFNMNFGNLSASNPLGDNRSITLSAKSFDLAISALETQGRTRVLANPKISVMNGQPAMISVGSNARYIDKVTQTIDATTGAITYSVSTSSVMSGLGMGVVATIMDNDEIILSLTPVTSQLEGDEIEYRTFGAGNTVGLPVVNLREMNTLVRVKNGELLVVGGLIDTTRGKTESKVPLLGDLPLINRLFRHDTETETKRELIILMRPKIIS